MRQFQIRLLNAPEIPAEERFVRMAGEVYGRARRWARSAPDSGLEESLPQNARTVLQELAESARRRAILSPDWSAAAFELAEICSRRIIQLAGDSISPAARAERRETNRARDLVLTDQGMELHGLSIAIDEVLDLGEALRARARLADE